jgi:hypothetical protein
MLAGVLHLLGEVAYVKLGGVRTGRMTAAVDSRA